MGHNYIGHNYIGLDSTSSRLQVDEALLWRTALELGVHVVRGQACSAARAGAVRVCWGAAHSVDEAAEAARRLAAAHRHALMHALAHPEYAEPGTVTWLRAGL